MAQIKITITIEANLMSDAHASVDAMDAKLRATGGRVVRARLTKDGASGNVAAKYDWTSEPAPAPLTKWVVLYSRIPTNYSTQQKLVIEASSAVDARDLAREHLGDRGKAFATYQIEDVRPFEPLNVAGRVLGAEVPRKLWNVAYRKVPTKHNAIENALVRAHSSDEAREAVALVVSNSIIVDAITEVAL